MYCILTSVSGRERRFSREWIEAFWAAEEWRVGGERKRGVKERCLDWLSSALDGVGPWHKQDVDNLLDEGAEYICVGVDLEMNHSAPEHKMFAR